MPAQHSDSTALPDEIKALVGRRSVLVASNRGPVEFVRERSGRLTTRRGAGGVVTALAGLARSLPVTWIAAAMTSGDREAFPELGAPARDVRLGRQPLRVRYVNVEPDIYEMFYDRVSNELLWFLQHYMWELTTTPTFTQKHYLAWQEGYKAVNRSIAQTIIDEVRQSSPPASARSAARGGANAIILLQDYHLYLAAAMIREQMPRATIQQFIHIPWPAIRYWEFLPERFVAEIYEGLAATDVLGFQTDLDARNFLECARVFLPGSRVDQEQGSLLWHRHRLLARAYPVTVDADEVQRTVMSAAGRAGAQELASVFESDARVLVRVDRLEPTKNIVRGLQAYELLLRTHPELHGTVRHLVLLVPSRQGLARYRKYDREVRRLVQRINSEFGTKEWEPITAFFENDRPRALVAAREADVVLVNPVIDGMNLVVKEAIVVSAHDAVIVLSRTAGAYRELRDAVLAVTATDIEETAEQLYEALSMPEQERHQRAQQARQIVEQTTPTQWALNQLRDVAYIRASPKEKMQAQSLQRVG